jgi:hypothetical protein
MTIEALANVFKGGRISGWVGRNRHILETGDSVPEEMTLLEKLSPSFAKNTEGSTLEEKAQIVREALALADQIPLSATNFKPISPDNPNHLVRK